MMAKKSKKLFAGFVALTIMLSLSMPAFAYTGDVDIEGIKKAAAQRAAENITEEMLKQEAKILQEVDEAFAGLPTVYSDGIYDRVNNMYYITALSTGDGAPATSCATIITTGIQYQKKAEEYASKYDEDCFRHFSWNYISSLSSGSEATRIFTINYEWYAVMEEEIQAKYNEYVLYYAVHAPNSVITSSLVATSTFARSYRNELISQTRNNPYAFQRLFNSAAIQDFCNNQTGRNYSISAKNYGTVEKAYEAAFGDGKLVWGDNPGSSRITSTFNTKTMWIP